MISKIHVKARLWFCLDIILLLLSSCQPEEADINLPRRNIIVYMIADNNLDYFALKDMNEMESGMDDYDGNMIVYIDRAAGAVPSYPVIYKIENDISDKIVSPVQKTYPEQNSADPFILRSVLSDILAMYPAQSYGLILWSHGSAWYPAGTEIKRIENKSVKSFGKDLTNELDIIDLKKSLTVHFDFILFDACYMGAIEVIYELRNYADFFISSPTEIRSSGFPYQSIVPQLFDNSINYESIAKSFFLSYDSLNDLNRSATISVVKTSAFGALVDKVNSIMNDSRKFQSGKWDEIQQFTTSQGLLFDFGSFIKNIIVEDSDYYSVKKELEGLVIYKASTERIMDELAIVDFSGVSIFVPDTLNKNFHDFYKKYEWYKNSGYKHYFDISGKSFTE